MNAEERLTAIVEGKSYFVKKTKRKVIGFRNSLLYSDDIYVRCRTEEQAKQLLYWAHKQGKRWFDEESFKDNLFYKYGEDICYNISEGFCDGEDRLENDPIEFEEVAIYES